MSKTRAKTIRVQNIMGLLMLMAGLAAGMNVQAADERIAENHESTGAQVFASGMHRVRVIELFTSEGCSSCPPADRWLSALRDQPGLWAQWVPLAFHVDYWDYIGWKDRFAQPSFGQRQRRYASEGNARAVYTPGIFVDGKDWRGWSRSEGADLPHPTDPLAGQLTLEVSAGQTEVNYLPEKAPNEELFVNLAWLGFDRQSDVTRGENRGSKLTNDFVVLQWDHQPMQRKGQTFHHQDSGISAAPETASAVAAWISSVSSQAPMQAVGGWLQKP